LPQARMYLFAMLKQLSEGDLSFGAEFLKSPERMRQVSHQSLMKPIFILFELVKEIIIVSDGSDDLTFVMNGVDCLEALYLCTFRLNKGNMNDVVDPNESQDEKSASSSQQQQQQTTKSYHDLWALRKRLSSLCHKFMQQTWPSTTKYNKKNIGKIVNLYIEHSETKFFCLDGELLTNADKICRFGRLKSLNNIAMDILPELTNTLRCRGPVENYPTCCYQSFGSYFSAVITFLPKELSYLFDSKYQSITKGTSKPEVVKNTLQILLYMAQLLRISFNLIKDNSVLVKRSFLLQLLRGGTIFMETFVSRAIPFLQTHFRHHEEAIINIIKQVQCSTRHIANAISHGWREKDPLLRKETPRAKKVLEIFISKIKHMMKKNNCLTALWSGNLKHKDIDGSALAEGESVDEDDSNVSQNDEPEDMRSDDSSID